ncbi:MAG: phage tail tape measure protein, partial [Micrococcales bacterium]|nr:phage tail tape measure protein [Micrococcales bacterium]
MGRAFAVSVRRFAAFSIATRAVGLFTSTLGDAVQTAINFERQLIKVSQVTGKSVNQLRNLTNEITKLSTGLGVSSDSLLEVSTVLAQAGLSANDTKVALNALAKAALAPNFDSITETAEGAIAILAQFGQGVEALESQLGSINAVAGAFAVEASDLIDVVRRTGGVFKSSGGSLNELLALFTSVRATTRESAESIGTGLRTIFTRIQRPKTIEFLKQFGVELVDLEGKFVGPYEAIRRLSEGLAGLGERDIT